MEITKIKEKYDRELKQIEQNISVYESSSNHELRIATKTLKVEAEVLRIIVDALGKQIPMRGSFEYDDEFDCPACGENIDCYDATKIKVCPECGQKLCWD